MDAAIKWNASPSRQITTLDHPRWRQLRQGLILALVGQPFALLLGLAGLYLVTASDGPLTSRLDATPEDVSILGWMLVGGGLFGYVLQVAGAWRCLFFAPQGHGAKDFQFACLLCVLAAPVCFAAAHYLGGEAVYAALQQGPDRLLRPDMLRAGPLLFLAGVACVLAGILLSSAFAGALSRCLNDVNAARTATAYFWFAAFLLGATVGLILQAGRTRSAGVLPGLGAAWLLCLLLHAMLIHGTARRVGRFLRGERLKAAVKAPAPFPSPSLSGATRRPGQVVLEAASYLRPSH
jgi:hypothetical protein